MGDSRSIELECLGSCGTAPAVLCNDVLYEDVTIESIDELIEKLPEDPQQYKDPSVDWEEAKH
jgi:NADH:ubiquinone oxidoreductase subunit E